MNRLDGRVALVTGAARGMGATHVAAFVAEGARVVATDLLEPEGRALADLLGESVRFVRHDVTLLTDWVRAIEVAEAAFGPIDVLVNNAGIGASGGVMAQSDADFERVMSVNVRGPFIGMRAIVPGMVRQGRGSVVNVSSISGLTGRPDGLAYTTSKWALRGMTKTAAADVAGTGVRINSVHPGLIRTPMTDGMTDAAAATQPIARLGEPEEVTAMVVFLASDDASYCTGAEFVVDGGYMLGPVRGS